jgi:hypothetical protein
MHHPTLPTLIRRRCGADLALLLAAGVALAASPQAPRFGDYQAKGFLSDYSGIKPVGGDSNAYRYRNPKVDVSKYNKLIIDRIKIWVKDDAAYKGVDPAEMKELVDYFHQAIVKAVGPAYPVVDKPGPDVLHLRIAVTDVVPNKPEASVVTLVVPFLWIGEAGAGAAEGKAGSTPFVGEATVEMEALDSETHTRVASFIERRAAKKYNWNQGVEKGVTSYMKAYSTWDYTKEAFDYWAKLLRERLDAAHGLTGANP